MVTTITKVGDNTNCIFMNSVPEVENVNITARHYMQYRASSIHCTASNFIIYLADM